LPRVPARLHAPVRGVAVIVALCALAAAYLVRSNVLVRISGLIRDNLYFIAILAMIFVVKFVATLMNSGLGVNIFYVIDDFLLLVVPAIGLLLVIRSSRDESLVVLALVLALVVSGVLASIEAAKGSVLLQGIVDVTVEESGVGGLTSKVRAETYRAKALFDNPLLLSEFVCVIWPWAVYLWFVGRTSLARWCGLVAGLAAPMTLYLTHTRSGWLIFSLGIAAFVAIRLWDRSSRVARVPLAIVYAVVIISCAAFAFQLATNSADYLASGIEGSRSVAERLSQYVIVATAWLDSPVIGYGMTRNFGFDLEFLNHIDNYWLRLLLEGGTVLFILFLVFVVSAMVSTMVERKTAPTREYRLFMTAAVVSMFSFCLYKLFLSMPTNNAYFLIVVALVARRKYWCKRIYPDARIALPQ